MKLLIDPDVAAQATGNFAALIASTEIVPTVFGYRDADPATGPQCSRCGRLEHLHTWQAISDGEVIDCGVDP